jgi:PPP family 3-phenylpropionic acid transporter
MYLHSLYKDKNLSQQFFAGIAYGLGGFVGASGSGYIYEFSPQGLYYVTAFITSISFIFLWIESKKTFKLN